MVNYRFGGKFLIFCQDVFIEPHWGNSSLGNRGDILDPRAALTVQHLEREPNPMPLSKAGGSPVPSLPLPSPPLYISVFFSSAREKSTLSPSPFP